MRILFWDIDGTLMRTGKAGLFAFLQATREVLHIDVDFKRIPTAGLTDCYIATEIYRTYLHRDPSTQEIETLLRCYQGLLPAQLEARKGQLMPNVANILAYFDQQEHYHSGLLTGNVIQGAKAKLAHFGILHYFDLGISSFGDHCPNRLSLASCAYANVQKRFPGISEERLYVIGDTPLDIQCGKHINARTVAVATGMYSTMDLSACAPWLLLDHLPAPEEFEELLAHNDN